MKAKVNWIENFKLEGHTDTGKIVNMDSGINASAASPAQLILQALAGCTMMDCILILTKGRKHINRFWVNVDAEEAESHPKIFKRIRLEYNFESETLNHADAERAIKLSEEKYCRVRAMLNCSSEITSSFKIYNHKESEKEVIPEYLEICV